MLNKSTQMRRREGEGKKMIYPGLDAWSPSWIQKTKTQTKKTNHRCALCAFPIYAHPCPRKIHRRHSSRAH